MKLQNRITLLSGAEFKWVDVRGAHCRKSTCQSTNHLERLSSAFPGLFYYYTLSIVLYIPRASVCVLYDCSPVPSTATSLPPVKRAYSVVPLDARTFQIIAACLTPTSFGYGFVLSDTQLFSSHYNTFHEKNHKLTAAKIPSKVALGNQPIIDSLGEYSQPSITSLTQLLPYQRYVE